MSILAALVTAILLPGFTPFLSGPSGGQVLAGTFPGTQRPGYVYLPPGFTPKQRYPVVYLLHGMPGSPSEYLYGTQLVQYADAGIASGALRPFIAVMPAAGPSHKYNGEWAGPLEQVLVHQVVPFVDANLPTVATSAGRVLAGLSAGGFGAVDIGIRNAGMFGAVESWSGYFKPLHDGPFKNARRALLAANDPTRLVAFDEARLTRAHTRFFVSSGPYHSHWFRPAQTIAFAKELETFGLPVTLKLYSSRKGEWREQLDAGLSWAFGKA